MIPCVVIAAIAVVALALAGSAPLGAGVGLTLLLCPLLMGTVMWVLMRQPDQPAGSDDHADPELSDHPQHAPTSAHP
jgi:hypothetical protein